MKTVVATKLGIYKNSRVRPGTVFEVPDNLTASWFKPVAEAKAVPPKESKSKEPDTFSELTHGGKGKKLNIESVI